MYLLLVNYGRCWRCSNLWIRIIRQQRKWSNFDCAIQDPNLQLLWRWQSTHWCSNNTCKRRSNFIELRLLCRHRRFFDFFQRECPLWRIHQRVDVASREGLERETTVNELVRFRRMLNTDTNSYCLLLFWHLIKHTRALLIIKIPNSFYIAPFQFRNCILWPKYAWWNHPKYRLSSTFHGKCGVWPKLRQNEPWVKAK